MLYYCIAASTVLLCNSKLLELAVLKCDLESTLFIAFSDDLDSVTSQPTKQAVETPGRPALTSTPPDGELTVRKQLSNIYNQLWDFCLMAQKLGLDCRVLLRENLGFKSKEQIIKEQRITRVINAGTKVDASASLSINLPRKSSLPSCFPAMTLVSM